MDTGFLRVGVNVDIQRTDGESSCQNLLWALAPGQGPVTSISIKYKVERDKRYLPYIELGRWLCSHFQLETQLKFHKPITQKVTQKVYNVEH